MNRYNQATIRRQPRSQQRMRVLTALAAAALVAAAAGSAGAQPSPKMPKKADHRGKTVMVDRVVAVINNDIVLQSELMARSAPMVADLNSITDPRERARRRDKIIDQALDDMINEDLVVQAANEAQLEVKDKEVEDALDEIKRQNKLDDKGLEQALAMQGYTIASYKKDVKKQILRMRAINMLVRPRVTVTDDDVRARYDEMGRRSATVSKVHLHHVLIALPEKPTEAELDKAKARAAEVIEKARAGEDFAKLAKEYSDDASTRDDGGDLGEIERGTIATEWEQVVFAMDKGEVRGPISGPRGLHVFYVSDVVKSDRKPFDEVKEQIRNDLYRQEMDKQTRSWMDELRKKAHIVKHRDAA